MLTRLLISILVVSLSAMPLSAKVKTEAPKTEQPRRFSTSAALGSSVIFVLSLIGVAKILVNGDPHRFRTFYPMDIVAHHSGLMCLFGVTAILSFVMVVDEIFS